MALGRAPFKKKVTCRNKENDKQYETKRAWNFFTIMVSWQQGHIKGGGGGGFNYSPPEFFLGKVKKRYKENEKWMGRELVVPVNIF